MIVGELAVPGAMEMDRGVGPLKSGYLGGGNSGRLFSATGLLTKVAYGSIQDI
jgi:hypothetical protein